MTIKFSDITGGGIPYGNNAGRPQNPAIGRLYSNGEEKRLELYTSTGWQNIVSETPGVVSISGNYLESVGSATLEITGTNFGTGAIAAVIGTNGVEIQAGSTTVNSIVSISATFSGLSAAYEPYDVKVTNTSNLFGLLPDGLYINQSPIWQTSAGSLGTFNEQVSITLSALSATDPESTPVTYSLASGSTLPSGISLNGSTGVISGTLPDITTDTTYSFTINASDGLNIIPRTFSFSSVAQVDVQYLVIAGGGAGAQDSAGGGGAGGYRSSVVGEMSGGGATAEPIFKAMVGTPYTVAVGNGGPRPNGPGQNNGSNSQFASIISLGGGSPGGSAGFGANGYSGGSGGGALSGTPGSGTSGQGYSGASTSSGGGGGGAGGPGNGNDGGPGVSSSITGTAVIRGGGGGGTSGSGGSGGGGTNTGYQASSNNGVANTGGGGSAHSGSWGGSGNGGSGVVILKYPSTKTISYTGTLIASTTTPVAGYKVTSFTAGSGTATFS